MSLRDLALEEAQLKALSDAVAERLKEIRGSVQAGLDQAQHDSGTRQIAVLLPDGTPVATVTLPEPNPEAKVTDSDALTAWVVANYPTEIQREFVTTVRGAFANRLLAEMTAAGVAQVVDKETGVIHTVPGVEVRPTRSRSHRLTFRPAGRELIAEAWQAGHLSLPGVTAPPRALPPAADEPSAA
ncbi:hypothetical protein [Streptacidiphilus sp. PAMC 29251]